MDEDKTIGYSKEDYYKISAKEALPKRCPILGKCIKAVWTRYFLGFRVVGHDISFKEFLSVEGQYWEPEKMIQEITQAECSVPNKGGDIVFWFASNICPEVTLFEEKYLPRGLRPSSACGDVDYDYESKRTVVTPKHYSECAEFSKYYFENVGQRKIKMPSVIEQIPEKSLEDYLVNNIEALEAGLKVIDRQKPIGKWIVDIFASDSLGSDVIIELKSKNLNRSENLKLTGQVSKYFNRLKKSANNLRLFIVVPGGNKDMLDELYHGLQHWIENDKVCLYQFDYILYDKKFIFSKVDFD